MNGIVSKVLNGDYENAIYLGLGLLIAYLLTKAVRFFKTKIFEPSTKKWGYKIVSIFESDEKRYKHIVSRYAAIESQIQYPIPELRHVKASLHCGQATQNVHNASAIIDSLSLRRLRNLQDVEEIILDPKSKRLAILGGPGAGKSTVAAAVIEHIYTKKKIKEVPVLVTFRRLSDEFSSDRDETIDCLDVLKRYFQLKMNGLDGDFPKRWLHRKLNSGECIVLLDGIDELENDEVRDRANDWVTLLIQTYPNCRYVVTARPYGINKKTYNHFDTRYIAPLNERKISDFISRWYEVIAEDQCAEDEKDLKAIAAELTHLSQSEKKEKILEEKSRAVVRAESFRSANSEIAEGLINRINRKEVLRDLARRPMFLGMMCHVHMMGDILPDRRCKLYERVLNTMLGNRDSKKQIKKKYSPDLKKVILSDLAFYLIKNEDNAIAGDKLKEFIRIHSKSYSENIHVEDFLEEIASSSGILIKPTNNDYSICHKSFTEYLAAYYFSRRPSEWGEKEILGLSKHKRWFESLLLLVGMVDATPLVKYIINNDLSEHLYFLILVLDEAEYINEEVKKLADNYIYGLAESSVGEKRYHIGMSLVKKRLKEARSLDDGSLSLGEITGIEYEYIKSEISAKKQFQSKHVSLTSSAKLTRYEAELICYWLSRYQGDGLAYRLPYLSEVDENESVWCVDYKVPTNESGNSILEKARPFIFNSLTSSLENDFGIHLNWVRGGDEVYMRWPELTTNFEVVRKEVFWLYLAILKEMLSTREYSEFLKRHNIFTLRELNEVTGITQERLNNIDKLATQFRVNVDELIENELFGGLLGYQCSNMKESLASVVLFPPVHKSFKQRAPELLSECVGLKGRAADLQIKLLVLSVHLLSGDVDEIRAATFWFVKLSLRHGKDRDPIIKRNFRLVCDTDRVKVPRKSSSSPDLISIDESST